MYTGSEYLLYSIQYTFRLLKKKSQDLEHKFNHDDRHSRREIAKIKDKFYALRPYDLGLVS